MRSKSWGEWRKYSFSDRRDLLLCQDTIVVSVVYTFFKCAHPLLSFQSWHLLPPRHLVHRFPVYKHSPVTTHHTLTTGICDRAINLIPSLQIHVFTWQQSQSPGRISQRLSVSRTKDSPVNGADFTHSKSGEIQGYSKSMKWGVSLPSESHTLISQLWTISVLLNI